MLGLEIIAVALLCIYGVLGYKRPVIAFVTAPLVAMTLVVVAVGYESIGMLAVAPLLLVVAMSAVIVATRSAESEPWCHRWAARVLIAVVVLLLLAAISIALEIGGGAILLVLFILGVVAAIAVFMSFVFVARRSAVMNVFSTIGSSMRQNLPLPMALDCAATGRSDATALILRRVKTWLVKGYSLSDALRRGYPQCPPQALAMVAAGERIGQVPAAIGAIEMDMKSRSTERLRLRPVHPLYPVLVLIIVFFLVAGIATFILPQFKTVREEMMDGAKLPVATRVLMGVMTTLLHGIHPLVYLCLFILVVAWPWVHRRLHRQRVERPGLYVRAVDSLRWHMPIVHWFEKNRAMGQVVELLRMSLYAGCPVNDAIRGTLKLDVNLSFRNQLARWLQRVERGEPIGESARRCGLGNTLAWAFDGSADAPVVLEMLESHYRSNYSYRINLARFILWPMGIILLGVIVGFVVYAVFMPLVTTISTFSAFVYP